MNPINNKVPFDTNLQVQPPKTKPPENPLAKIIKRIAIFFGAITGNKASSKQSIVVTRSKIGTTESSQPVNTDAIAKVVKSEIKNIKTAPQISSTGQVGNVRLSTLKPEFEVKYTFAFTPNTNGETRVELYEQLKSALLKCGIPQMRIKFDDDNCEIKMGYSCREMLLLRQKNPELYKWFGRGDDIETQDTLFASQFERKAAIDKMREYNVDFFVERTGTGGLRLEEEANALVNKGKEYLARNPGIAANAPRLPEGTTPNNLIVKAFEKNQGLVVGEVHSDITPKKFLMDNMEELKNQGVKTIFLEHVLSDTMQEELDDFYRTGEMPPLLDAYLTAKDKDAIRLISDPKKKGDFPNYGMKALIVAAQKKGIRVVAIDTEASYACGRTSFGNQGPDRYLGMNYTASEIIKKEIEKNGGKYVALVGSGHVSTCEGMPGMSQFLNCPNVIVEDQKVNLPAGFQSEVDNYKGEVGHVNAIIVTDTNAKII